MPIRSAGESFAFPIRPGPAPRSAHRPSGPAAGVSHRRSPMDDQRLGALLRPQGGRRGPGGAAPHRERRAPVSAHHRRSRARLRFPPRAAGGACAGPGADPVRSPLLKAPAPTSGPEAVSVRKSLQVGALPRTKPRSRRMNLSSCAREEPVALLLRAVSGCGGGIRGPETRPARRSVCAGDVEASRYPDPGRSLHTASATRSSSTGVSFASALSSRASVAGVWTTTGPLP